MVGGFGWSSVKTTSRVASAVAVSVIFLPLLDFGPFKARLDSCSIDFTGFVLFLVWGSVVLRRMVLG